MKLANFEMRFENYKNYPREVESVKESVNPVIVIGLSNEQNDYIIIAGMDRLSRSIPLNKTIQSQTITLYEYNLTKIYIHVIIQ